VQFTNLRSDSGYQFQLLAVSEFVGTSVLLRCFPWQSRTTFVLLLARSGSRLMCGLSLSLSAVSGDYGVSDVSPMVDICESTPLLLPSGFRWKF
jgi:hypothetical protein